MADKFSVYQSFMRYTSKVFDYAVHLDILQTNPFTKAIKPTKVAKKKESAINFYTVNELQKFLDYLEGKVKIAY
ncbi:MAG: hypothetical protein RR557_08060 [Bacilli bacterium]